MYQVVRVRSNSREQVNLSEINATALEKSLFDRTVELEAALSENAVLRRELHHRVRNHLAMISSLLSIHEQKLASGPPTTLETIQNRVSSMAAVHEQLSRSESLDSVLFDDCVRSLSSRLQASVPRPVDIDLGLRLDRVELPLDQAIPAAMILNELLSNALRHAFPNPQRTPATVRVELTAGPHQTVTMTVIDNAGTLNNLPHSHGMGLQLAQLFALQLNSSIVLNVDRGTRCELCFQVRLPANGQGGDPKCTQKRKTQ